MIRDELRPIATHSDGYSQHCSQYEPVGMDGRYDWFRWHCRECDRKYISMRAEKSMKYYECKECGALHFVYKGFFTQPDRKNGSETVPLRPDEVRGVLCRVKLAYVSNGEVFSPSEEWHYGTEEGLEEKCEKDAWQMMEPIEVVEA